MLGTTSSPIRMARRFNYGYYLAVIGLVSLAREAKD